MSQPDTLTRTENWLPTTFERGATSTTVGGSAGEEQLPPSAGQPPPPQPSQALTAATISTAALWRMSLLQDQELDAAIQLSAPRGQVGCHRLIIAVARRLDALGVDALCDEVGGDRGGAVF